MNRAVTVSAASGSLSALLWQLTHEFLQRPPSCPICEVIPDGLTAALPETPELSFKGISVDLPSLLLGLLIGLAIGPLLDFCFLLRQSWRAFVRGKLAQLSKQQRAPLYRLA